MKSGTDDTQTFILIGCKRWFGARCRIEFIKSCNALMYLVKYPEIVTTFHNCKIFGGTKKLENVICSLIPFWRFWLLRLGDRIMAESQSFFFHTKVPFLPCFRTEWWRHYIHFCMINKKSGTTTNTWSSHFVPVTKELLISTPWIQTNTTMSKYIFANFLAFLFCREVKF